MSFLAYPTTSKQKELLALAGDLADTFAKRADEGDWEGRFPAENFEDLRRSGYLALVVPADLGGWGASLLDVMHAQYRLAQGDASTALVVSMHMLHTARLVDGRTEYPPLVERICRDIVERGTLINSAVSEPATGSPSRGGRSQTTARRQPDGSWVINGRKTFTTGSYALHYIMVGCSIEDDANGAPGLPELHADKGNFLVLQSTPGVRIEDTWHTMAMRGTGSNDLVLENVHIGADAYVEGQVSPVPDAQVRLAGWSTLTSAVYLGTAQAARDEAVDFARKRRPNSLQQPIASVPHIQEKTGKMELALLQSRALLFGLSEQFSSDPLSVDPSLFAAAKYVSTNQAIEIVDLAMRIVGAASLSLSSPLQRYYRNVRAGLHNPPMDDVVISMLAKRALEPARQKDTGGNK
ncbi:MAG: acyl-CoA dehydrogenase family protein [Ktedonobacteraceae bacterium]